MTSSAHSPFNLRLRTWVTVATIFSGALIFTSCNSNAKDELAHHDHEHEGEEGVFEKREVKIGQTDGVRTEIVEGLKAGETVVAKGAYQVKLAASSSVIPEGHNHNH